jgi:hypothetical protein
MIELTDDQVHAVENGEGLPVVVNPRTREEYVLVRRDVFDRMRRVLQPLNRGWDDPALDVYEEYRKRFYTSNSSATASAARSMMKR